MRQYGWKGLLLEPQTSYYEKLVKNYSGTPGLTFLNCAISESEEPKKFYRIKEMADLPTWTQGLGSFDINTILKHSKEIPGIENYIITDSIDCISFESLLSKYEVKQIDLLQVDTEGYDYEIINMIDLNHIRPSIIAYESKHISMKKQQDLVKRLTSNG